MITRKHLIWPGILILLLGALVAVDITMIIVSSSNTAIRIERTADEHAPLADQAGRISVDRWRMSVQLGAPSTEFVPVVVRLADLGGAAIEDETMDVSVVASPVNTTETATSIDAELAMPGMFIAHVPVTASGMWDLRIHASDGVGSQDMHVQRVIRPSTHTAARP